MILTWLAVFLYHFITSQTEKNQDIRVSLSFEVLYDRVKNFAGFIINQSYKLEATK